MLEIEKYIPQPNFYVGLLFNEGYFFYKMLRKQQLTIKAPYDFEDGYRIAPHGTSGWETPTDAAGRFYLEPQEEETFYQFFMGIAPSRAKVFLQYTQREDRMNLITPRTVPGTIGYWSGEQTPYSDPSPSTELWTVHDLVPYFNVENDQAEDNTILDNQCPSGTKIAASFYITPFTYQVVKDRNRILQFLRGERRCTVVTMGDGQRPIKAPAWMNEDYAKYAVQPEEV